MGQKKIFGIGLSKTGTTSLARALEILGYTTKDYLGITRYDPNDLTCIDLEAIDKNDAFTDTPIPSFYKALDQRYPNSKFILTVRDIEGWLKSCKKQFTKALAKKESPESNRLIRDLYGCVVFDERKFARGYRQFVEKVIEYFKGRDQDLLVIDICADEGWGKLCHFLGKPVPDVPFPKANVSAIHWINIEDVIKIIKQSGREVMKVYARKLAREGVSQRELAGDCESSKSMSKVFRKGGAISRLLPSTDKKKEFSKLYGTSHKVIKRGLKSLRPALPVLSDEMLSTPYEVRKYWSHFWLVDPLCDFHNYTAKSGEFTISIALIEDGRPILGVVYAPAMGALYYAKGGMGSHKKTGDGRASPLHSKAKSKEGKFEVNSQRRKADMQGGNIARCETILDMCKVAERVESKKLLTKPFFEWEIAAVDAVLKISGKDMYDLESGKVMQYNKSSIEKQRMVIE